MQWNINLPTGSSIRLIEAYVQFQSKRKTQIITFGIRKPLVSRNGKKHYKNRLIPDLSNSKFTLTITDAKLNDSGNYSLYVISEQPLEEADASVTVYIHGMFFCVLYLVITIIGNSSESQSQTQK